MPKKTIDDLHFGHAVAVVDLTACIATDNLNMNYIDYFDGSFGNFAPGRYAWKFENIKAIEPFPVKGKQGFFNVDYEPREP